MKPREPDPSPWELRCQVLVAEAEYIAHGWRFLSVHVGDVWADDGRRWLAWEAGSAAIVDGHRHVRVHGPGPVVAVAVAPPDAAATVTALEDLGRLLGLRTVERFNG
ncbi:MAG TPA: hypothetical protein VNF50_00405 [Acidimicrobiales bacterium]|nr:hypothetical protein [Acidimicrobiales bacterium]